VPAGQPFFFDGGEFVAFGKKCFSHNKSFKGKMDMAVGTKTPAQRKFQGRGRKTISSLKTCS
jgi:hypothetical protein